MEHLNGRGLVTNTRRQEAAELLPALILRGCALGCLQALGASLRRDRSGQISELLGLECCELIAGLCRLQCSGGGLARCYKRGHLRAVGVQIGDNAGVHSQRILQRRQGRLPTRLRVSYQCLARCAGRGRGIGCRKGAVDLSDVVGDALRLIQKLLGALDR